MLHLLLAKYQVKGTEDEKKVTVFMEVNLMLDDDYIRDLYDFGINPAEFEPSSTTSENKRFKNIPLTTELCNLCLKMSDGSNNRMTIRSGEETLFQGDMPDHCFKDLSFDKIVVKMVKDGKKFMPILTMEFTVPCSDDFHAWLYECYQRAVKTQIEILSYDKPVQRTLGDMDSRAEDLANRTEIDVRMEESKRAHPGFYDEDGNQVDNVTPLHAADSQ